jgi:hypothetical protein
MMKPINTYQKVANLRSKTRSQSIPLRLKMRNYKALEKISNLLLLIKQMKRQRTLSLQSTRHNRFSKLSIMFRRNKIKK